MKFVEVISFCCESVYSADSALFWLHVIASFWFLFSGQEFLLKRLGSPSLSRCKQHLRITDVRFWEISSPDQAPIQSR